MKFPEKRATKKTENAPPGSRRNIFIVEDHPTFCEGLVQIINAEMDLTVCGQASDAEHGLKEINRLMPDLALVDITLPGKSGLELIRQLRMFNRKVRILVVSMHDEALYAERVLRAGGDGYIMKQEDPEEILNAIRDVLGGHLYVSEEVMARTRKTSQKPAKPKQNPMDPLTDQELNVLELLGRGKNEREIARRLRLDVKKIQGHCAEMRKKLKLKSNNALIRYAAFWVEDAS